MKSAKLNKRGFYVNIVLPSALAVLLFIGTLFLIVIPAFENAMMDRKREMIMQLTRAANSILDKYHKDESEGLFSREEAQLTAISRLRYLRYGDENKDYFWIITTDAVMVMHPYRPDMEGDNLVDYKDPGGTRLFHEASIVAGEHGSGYINYLWQWKDDSTHIVPKVSYVKHFEPWNWVIGTGIYIEDVKREIAGLTRTLTSISVAISLIIASLLFYTGRQSFQIEGKRLKAEEELHHSREKYRSLVEASTEGLLMYMDGEISFVNAVFEKMTGQTSTEILQKKVEEIIEIPREIAENIDNDQYDFKQVTLESKLMATHRDEPVDVVLNIVPIVFYGKKALIFSLKDVSSDVQIKEELFYSRDKFKTLMDKLNMGLFRTSLDLKGKLLEINETGLKILGFKSFDEMAETYILDIFDDIEDKKTFRKNLLAKGFIKNQVLRLKRKNGDPVLVSVSLVVVFDDGKPRYCDGLIEDVSMRKSFEQKESTINTGFTSFAQLLHQPVNNVAQPVLLCDYHMTLYDVACAMTEENRQYALISAGDGEVIGYVTDEIMRASRCSGSHKTGDPKVFEVMNAPVVSFSSDDMLLEVSRGMKKKNTRYAAIRNAEGAYTGYIASSDLIVVQNFLTPQLYNNIDTSRSVADLKHIRKEYVDALVPLTEINTHPSVIFRNLSLLSDALSTKIIELAVKELGTPPVTFAFINMGSEGRKEQTLKTDQDNAIIYADPDPEIREEAEQYFARLGKKICTHLDEVGYHFCKGDVMAMNPAWCQPLSVWKDYFKKWINNGKAQDLLDLCIFFDFRYVYGEESLSTELRDHVAGQSRKNPAYLYHLAQNTFNLKPQVGFWGNILLETAGAPPETVDIKRANMPIVNFARIYSLKNSLPNCNTIERLNALRDKGVLQPAIADEIIRAFDYLATLRLKRQASLIKNDATPDNLINTKTIGEFDQTIIKKVLSIINNMLLKLSQDFKGTA